MTQALGVAGLGLTVLGLVLGFIYFRVQRVRKGLIYEVVSNSPVVTTAPGIGGLRVLFNDRPVENAHLMVVRFANSGNVPIQSSDFSAPLRIAIANDGELLSSDVIEADPAPLEDQIITDSDGNAVSVRPLLLNSKDSFSLRLVVDVPSPDLMVTARIVGVGDIERREAVPPEERTTAKVIQAGVAILGTIVAGITFLLSAYLTRS